MKTHRYKKYSDYVRAQIEGFERKKSNIWADEKNIKYIASYLARSILPKTGICHGTRGGYEQAWFMKHLAANVIGTEIGTTDAPFTVRWDFNKENPDWLGRFDFVYSNAWDHAYDIIATLDVWKKQLAPGGLLVLEHSTQHIKVTETDPTGMTLDELMKLLPGCKVDKLPNSKNQDRRVILWQN